MNGLEVRRGRPAARRGFGVLMMLAIAVCGGAPGLAQVVAPPAAAAGADPDTAPISTADVGLFWRAYDAWVAEGARPERLAPILAAEYLARGSAGVQDFTPDRIISAEALAARILEDRTYYERVRPVTERIASLEAEMRGIFRAFKARYPDAVFPALYVVVGRRNSGGMSSPRALILGAEMFAGAGARLDPADVLPMVAHELVHFQQRTDANRGGTLLGASMREGGADFIAEQIAGRHINERVKSYGDAHEHELWPRFLDDIDRPDGHRAWLYNGRDPNRIGPPDLGYYVGYKVSQAYFQSARDKAAAFRRLVQMEDPRAILDESRYGDRFAR